jgi:hypothetical protein
MPQLFFLAALSAGAYAGLKLLAAFGNHVSNEVRRAEEELRKRAGVEPAEKDLGSLEYDPKTGVYKPTGGA